MRRPVPGCRAAARPQLVRRYVVRHPTAARQPHPPQPLSPLPSSRRLRLSRRRSTRHPRKHHRRKRLRPVSGPGRGPPPQAPERPEAPERSRCVAPGLADRVRTGSDTASAGGPPAPAPAAAPAASAAPPAAPAPGGQDMAQGVGQVRNMWPDILEAVKNRRRFTWILLSQNAQVTGFDGTTLQIGFLSAGARDNFASSGSEEVLKQALAERFNAQWRVEAVVDPSGGGGMPPQTGGGGGRPPAAPYQPPAAPQAQSQSYESRPAPSQQPQPPAQQPPSQQSQQSGQSGQSDQGYSRAAPEPSRSVAPEDDTAEADDPDLVDSALSGHDLIVRELGATVVEEFNNE